MIHFKILLTIVFLGFSTFLWASTTTVKQYDFTIESNLIYGMAEGFCGELDTLQLDIYTPLNNEINRPVFINIHGGAFRGGAKDDLVVQNMAAEFAARGYVVANIEYRMGYHITEFPPIGAICFANPNQCLSANSGNPIADAIFSGFASLEVGACGYPYDMAEVHRVLYRTAQDVKGAIRYMKGRNDIDKTDNNKVFVGGNSAGAYAAMVGVYLNEENEKMPEAYSIDAIEYLFNHPNVNGGYAVCYDNVSPCGTANNTYTRPDLGPVAGTLNLNGYDASVAGVIDWFGAVTDISLFDGPDDPPIFLYQQTGDPLVPCDYAPIMQSLYTCAVDNGNLQAEYCYSFYEDLPNAYGACAMLNHFQNNPQFAPTFSYYIPETPQYDGHYWDDYNGHATAATSFFDRVVLGDDECLSSNEYCLTDNFRYIKDQSLNWSNPLPIEMTNLSYTNTTDYLGNAIDLKIDFYQPQDLTANEQRPLILFLHSGAFYDNSLSKTQFSDACKLYTKYGFNTATIDYRIGWENGDANNFCNNEYLDLREANYKALQDVFTSLNYIEDNNNTLKVDLQNVIVVGYSAGALLAMQSVYMENTNKWQQVESGLDYTTLGNLPSHNATIKGIVSIAGGLKDAEIAFNSSSKVPILFAAGDCDDILSYTNDNIFQCSNMEKFEGSYCLSSWADTYDIPNQLKNYQGEGHELLADVDLTEDLAFTVTQFISDYALCCKSETVKYNFGDGNSCFDSFNFSCSENLPTHVEVDALNISLYPNPSNAYFKIEGLLSNYDLEIYNMNGNLVTTLANTSNSKIIDIHTLPIGMYLVKISHQNYSEVVLQQIIKY